MKKPKDLRAPQFPDERQYYRQCNVKYENYTDNQRSDLETVSMTMSILSVYELHLIQ